MAQSPCPTRQYTSENFIESCGAVVHDSTLQKICLIHVAKTSMWVLPKGRRNVGEAHREAALREVYEETGYRCQILPVDMVARTPLAGDAADAPDVPRMLHSSVEPFMVTVRTVREGQVVKIIWWYVAMMCEIAGGAKGPGEEGVETGQFSYPEAEQLLFYETDREVLRKAKVLVDTLIE